MYISAPKQFLSNYDNEITKLVKKGYCDTKATLQTNKEMVIESFKHSFADKKKYKKDIMFIHY